MSGLRERFAHTRSALLTLWRRIEDPRWNASSNRLEPGAPERELGVFGDCFLHGMFVQAAAANDRKAAAGRRA